MPAKPISITLPEELLERINDQVQSGQFASVSEYVRHAVRLAMDEESTGAERGIGARRQTSVVSATNPIDSFGNDGTSANTWLTGKVQRGQQLGGKLGFPTINLDPSLLPATVAHGVYAAQVEYEDRVYLAAAHFGPRKTLGEWKPTLEFHLLDFDQHIPGSLVRFRLLEQLRASLRFDSLEALKKQLAEDVAKVRGLSRVDQKTLDQKTLGQSKKRQ